jgi:hypothetical protein
VGAEMVGFGGSVRSTDIWSPLLSKERARVRFQSLPQPIDHPKNPSNRTTNGDFSDRLERRSALAIRSVLIMLFVFVRCWNEVVTFAN